MVFIKSGNLMATKNEPVERCKAFKRKDNIVTKCVHVRICWVTSDYWQYMENS